MKDTKSEKAREIYYLIAIDDDHKPVHTTKVCGTYAMAALQREEMMERYHDVLICEERSTPPSSPA